MKALLSDAWVLSKEAKAVSELALISVDYLEGYEFVFQVKLRKDVNTDTARGAH